MYIVNLRTYSILYAYIDCGTTIDKILKVTFFNIFEITGN